MIKNESILLKILIPVANALIEAIFPTKCMVCDSFFHPPQNDKFFSLSLKTMIPEATYPEHICFDQVIATFVCPDCTAGFVPIESPFCLKCGTMSDVSDDESHLCLMCKKHLPYFGIARAAGGYGGILRKLIHLYKYDKKIQLRHPFGILLFSAFVRHWNMNDIDMILPVPLYIKRMRWRGFNQAYLFIKDWYRIAELLNIDLSHIRIEREILVRTRDTKTQVGMTRKERQANVRDVFKITNPSKIKDKQILLVDDVFTTGATANECVQVLLKHGAKRVDVLTLARVLNRDD